MKIYKIMILFVTIAVAAIVFMMIDTPLQEGKVYKKEINFALEDKRLDETDYNEKLILRAISDFDEFMQIKLDTKNYTTKMELSTIFNNKNRETAIVLFKSKETTPLQEYQITFDTTTGEILEMFRTHQRQPNMQYLKLSNLDKKAKAILSKILGKPLDEYSFDSAIMDELYSMTAITKDYEKKQMYLNPLTGELLFYQNLK